MCPAGSAPALLAVWPPTEPGPTTYRQTVHLVRLYVVHVEILDVLATKTHEVEGLVRGRDYVSLHSHLGTIAANCCVVDLGDGQEPAGIHTGRQAGRHTR